MWLTLMSPWDEDEAAPAPAAARKPRGRTAATKREPSRGKASSPAAKIPKRFAASRAASLSRHATAGCCPRATAPCPFAAPSV